MGYWLRAMAGRDRTGGDKEGGDEEDEEGGRWGYKLRRNTTNAKCEMRNGNGVRRGEEIATETAKERTRWSAGERGGRRIAGNEHEHEGAWSVREWGNGRMGAEAGDATSTNTDVERKIARTRTQVRTWTLAIMITSATGEPTRWIDGQAAVQSTVARHSGMHNHNERNKVRKCAVRETKAKQAKQNGDQEGGCER